ncbi:ABC transporter substrate-binding protein [Peribacillus frigoritolerans]|uniref:ABC transporter substrate-binding protein n=1 Tax=Peribacillus frigoritolerans TaxID=450367 RepID=UPI00105965E1|nr:extracellular solute-binding protein [Peribacillus frigoritolerans]TDL76118.1 extracellular solute-binding protein [Peribacillus frigoritolerans]
MRVKKVFIIVLAFLMVGCSSQTKVIQEPRSVVLEFFSVKEETRPIFNQLITDFEARYPGIKINQVIVPNGMSVLKTRIARGDAPDLFISYPFEQDYITRARKGYLLDLSREMFLDRIQPTIQQRYRISGHMYGAAFTQNAVGVLYNKQHFKQLDLKTPSTWDEWVEVMETLEKAGKKPLVMANKEADLTSVLTLNFVANVFPPSYWKSPLHLQNDSSWMEINTKVETLLSYAQKESFSMSYSDANEAFAFGEGSMYVMGTWALPIIERLKPDLDYGIFPVPVSNSPDENRVLGGVDIGISISSDTEYSNEAKLFLAFLTEQANAQALSLYEGSISTIIGVRKTKESLAILEKKVQDGEAVNWPNHYWAGGTAAETEYRLLTQQYFYDLDKTTYLKKLEEMFQKYTYSPWDDGE